MSLPRCMLWLSLALLHSLSLVGCGSGELVETCSPGDVRACGTLLEEHGDKTITCYRGTSMCQGGSWGECSQGELSREKAPLYNAHQGLTPSDSEVLSYSQPTRCDPASALYNACDPECRFFEEVPTSEIVATPGTRPFALELPRFEGNPQTTQCLANPCEDLSARTTQNFLDYGCSECVTKVCDSAGFEYCCGRDSASSGRGWDSECVDLAAQLCSTGYTGELCETTLFTSSSMKIENQSGARLRDSLLVACGDFETESGFAMSGDSGLWVDGDIVLKQLNSASLSVPRGIFANGSIGCDNGWAPRATVYGDLVAGKNAEVCQWTVDGDVSAAWRADCGSGAGTILGAVRGNARPRECSSYGAYMGRYVHSPFDFGCDTNEIPVLDEDCRGGQNFGNDATVPGPGTYGSIDSRSSITLRGEGTYYFRDIRLDAANLILDLHGAPQVTEGWTIVICGSGSFRVSDAYRSRVSLRGGVMKQSDLVVYAGTSGVVRLGHHFDFTGLLVAPQATVDAGDNVRVDGAVWSKRLNAQTALVTNGLDPNACLDAFDERTELLCVVENPVYPANPTVNHEPCTAGRDCQFNHRCENVATGVDCEHSKCTSGAPLANDCDPCVAQICEADSNCCTTSWSQECVTLVKRVCDAECAAEDCGHGVCDEGAPLSGSCDGSGCIASVCAARPECCSDEWDASCVAELSEQPACKTSPADIPFGEGRRLCDFALYSRLPLPEGTSTHQVATGMMGQSSATVSLSLPEVPFTSGGQSVFDKNITLAPGSYRYIDLSSYSTGYTLTLQPGDYYLSSLRLLGSSGAPANLVVPASGEVRIFSAGSISMNEVRFHHGSLGTPMKPADAGRLHFYSSSNYTSAFTLVGGLNFWGTVRVPHGGVRVRGGDTKIHGSVWADRFDLDSLLAVESSGVTGAGGVCEALNLEGLSDCLPLELASSLLSETGTCVDNEQDSFVGGCEGTGYDLAVGVPCDEASSAETMIPLCNHGESDFRGALQLGYWEGERQQMALEPTLSPDGLCEWDDITIAAGTCERAYCGLPTVSDAGDQRHWFTLMLDPFGNNPGGECENRRADNWSVYNAQRCQDASAPVLVETQSYDISCEGHQRGSWGLIFWESDLEPGAMIEISGVLAATAAERDAAIMSDVGFELLGRVEDQSRGGHESCPPGAQCVIDISEELQLSPRSQDQYLALKFRLDVGTSESVVRLSDWHVTYTCQDDQ